MAVLFVNQFTLTMLLMTQLSSSYAAVKLISAGVRRNDRRPRRCAKWESYVRGQVNRITPTTLGASTHTDSCDTGLRATMQEQRLILKTSSFRTNTHTHRSVSRDVLHYSVVVLPPLLLRILGLWLVSDGASCI